MAERVADSEKITINLGHVDLGRTDLMVQEGFYSNRSDFIRAAIRNQLERHADVVQQATVRKKVELGLRHFSRADLEEARATGQTLHIRVLGLVSIANDVTAELARATIGSIVVLGALHASSVIKTALAGRIRCPLFSCLDREHTVSFCGIFVLGAEHGVGRLAGSGSGQRA